MSTFDNAKTYQESMDCLIRYYGFARNQFPKETGVDIAKECNAYKLKEIYLTISPSNYDDEILHALQLLVYVVRTQSRFNRPYTAENLKEQMRRRDLLRLMILCDTTKTGDTIIIKNRSRSFQLHNDMNWFISDVVKPVVDKELGESLTVGEAFLELENANTRHRGRRAKDPQMLNLIWGTYQLISDRVSFRTPMPNALCNFIIKLLILMDVLPENTEIDAFWIRAQLRYMASRKRDIARD